MAPDVGPGAEKALRYAPPFFLLKSLSLSTLRIRNREEPSMQNFNQEVAAKKSKGGSDLT